MTAALTLTFLNHAVVQIRGGPELKQWRETYRLAVPGAEFTPQYKRGHWDGTWVPGEWMRAAPGAGEAFDFRCSRGLLPRLHKDLELSPYEAQVLSGADAEAFVQQHPRGGELRDYQRQAVVQVLTAGWGRVAFATNAGKGAVIALLAQFAESRGYGALVLCDEIAVFDALRGELREWAGIEPQEVRGGAAEEPPPTGQVTLAMVPTLAKRLKGASGPEWAEWLRSHAMLLLDEADKAGADTWRSILSRSTMTAWRAGFSGTFADDVLRDIQMDELMGPVLQRVKNKEMVARGVSAKPEVEAHAFDCTAALAQLPREWWGWAGPARRQWTFEQAVVYNKARHAFLASLIRPNASTAVVVNRVDHGHELAAALTGAVFLDGSASEAARLAALEAFQKGEVRTLIVTKILDRGSNRLGHATDLIFASGEGSSTQVLQRLGRGLRRGGGKKSLRLVDIVDRVGMPGAALPRWKEAAARYLHSAAKRRLHVYRTEGFDLRIAAGR